MTRSEGETGEQSSGDGGEPEDGRRFAVLLARDIAFAVILVAIILGAVFAYTQLWPPVVVVESDSMQHGRTQSFIGVVDTGDIVLVQAVRQPSDVTTYVEGRVAGYETYSNYGDVIIFYRPGASLSATPIIHRAIVYVVPNPSGGVDVPSLAALPAGEWSGVKVGGSPTSDSPYGLVSFILFRVRSWDANAPVLRDLRFDLTGVTTAGFLTKGDRNPSVDNWGDAVAVTRIRGKARGELPWFGLIKLTLFPTSSCCTSWGAYAPKNSWDSLAITLVLLPISLFLIDYAYAFAEDLWKLRKKREKTPAGEPVGGGETTTPHRPPSGSDAPDDEAR